MHWTICNRYIIDACVNLAVCINMNRWLYHYRLVWIPCYHYSQKQTKSGSPILYLCHHKMCLYVEMEVNITQSTIMESIIIHAMSWYYVKELISALRMFVFVKCIDVFNKITEGEPDLECVHSKELCPLLHDISSVLQKCKSLTSLFDYSLILL